MEGVIPKAIQAEFARESAEETLARKAGDLGAAFVSKHIRYDQASFEIAWSYFEADRLRKEDLRLEAARSVVATLPQKLHRFALGQATPFTSDDCRSIGGDAYLAILECFRDFGYPSFRFAYSIPRWRRGRWESLSLRFRKRPEDETLLQLYALAALYFDWTEGRDISARRKALRQISRARISRRQVECARWLIAGKTLEDTAEIVGISYQTVRYHIDSLKVIYGLGSTVQTLVAVARDYDIDPYDASSQLHPLAKVPPRLKKPVESRK